MHEIKIYRESEITPDLDRRLRNLLCACFPKSKETFSATHVWNGSRATHTLVMETDNTFIASLALIDRTVLVGDHQLRIAGIGNVCVHPDHRGHHYGMKLVNNAMDLAMQKDFDCGLLFTGPPRDAMYRAHNWHDLHPRPVIRTDAACNNVRVHATSCIMFHPLALPTFPDGTVHLQGDTW